MPTVFSKWKRKVVLTNGTDSRQVLAVWSSSSGIHASAIGDTHHTTYHTDGRWHVAGDTRHDRFKRRLRHARNIRMKNPPADLVGVENLYVQNLGNQAFHFSEAGHFPKLRLRSRESAWEVDSRSLPEGAPLALHIGVVGSGGKPALDAYIATELTRAGEGWTVTQVELETTLNPSPYLIVLQGPQSARQAIEGIVSGTEATTLSDGQMLTFRFPPGLLGEITPSEEQVWPPVPCKRREGVRIVVGPFSEAFTRVTDDLRLAVEPLGMDGADFNLVVNGEAIIKAGNHVLYRVAKHATAPSVSYHMRYGYSPQAECEYVHAGMTYYIKCAHLSSEKNPRYTTTTYSFVVAWEPDESAMEELGKPAPAS